MFLETSTETTYKAREQKLRRLAKKNGLCLRKSRCGYPCDGYMIVDPYFKRIEYGERFDLNLDDVEDYLSQED